MADHGLLAVTGLRVLVRALLAVTLLHDMYMGVTSELQL